MSSSADTTPISPARFAAAIKDLPLDTLHLKVLEIRNSIAHLQYSNDQLKPFAEGTSTSLSNSDSAPPTEGPDQDCIDAIRENEQVIDRMAERIALIRAEVEDRGVSWTEFQSKDEIAAAEAQQQKEESQPQPQLNGHSAGEEQQQHSAWSDGTFQTGTIRNDEVRFDGQPGRPEGGGSLRDEELLRALEERMRNLDHGDGDEDADGGMHL
ncbi:hypothetical protein ACRE_086700 [Hapsidospora chrysogenum ATCC 11550]|uniref:Uncharacterized protein n=1 Tax=Hapsidospora chrysogenum (strain ATCC 11550 / CBS 779.69 / DSM 880 / IAM 14645 / JCM 23072 / IMI 49137) TaxID=857340 RepID=A0A086SU46_HAPC1|nr:hypothetical protein ACRE_086700 [Hapsidospora chrysogenum ATCC 11550]